MLTAFINGLAFAAGFCLFNAGVEGLKALARWTRDRRGP